MSHLLKQTLLSTPRLLIGIVAALLASAAQAEDTRWYQIEIIVAERLSNAYAEEQHPTTLAPAVRTSKRLKDYPSIGTQAYTRLPIEFRRLNKISQRLRNSGQYKVLFHEAWPMDVTKQKSATWIKINAGQRIAGHNQLEGAIGVSLGRFLHLHTQLHLNDFTKTANVNQTDLSQLVNLPSPQAKIKQRFSLIQKRKMRSVELHYIDHPKLAVLVRFDPYSPETGPMPKPNEAPVASITKLTSENLEDVLVSPLTEALAIPLISED